MGSTPEQHALRPRNSTLAGWPAMKTFSGMLVRSACCAGCDSSPETAPSPVAHNVIISPGFGALVGETTVLVAGSVATASPEPVVFRVNTPILFGTPTVGTVALSRPLYVTVIVPVPAGVLEGRMPAICAASE